MTLGLQSKLAGLMFCLSVLTEKKDFLFPEGRGLRNLIIPIKLMRVSRNQVNNLSVQNMKNISEWQKKTEQHEDGSGLFAFLLAGQSQHKERRSQKELMRDLPWELEEHSKVSQQGCTERVVQKETQERSAGTIRFSQKKGVQLCYNTWQVKEQLFQSLARKSS